MIPIPDDMPSRCARLVRIAEQNPQRAVRLARRACRRVLEHDSCALAWTTYALGWALLRWEELHEARTILQRAQEIFTAQEMTIPALHAQLGTLVASTLNGPVETLYAEWETLALAYEHQRLPIDAARARLYQSGLLNLLGQPRAALALTQTMYPILAKQQTLDEWGRLLLIVSSARGDCGELDQALDAVNQALEYFRHLGQPIDIARALIERSWLLQRREDFTAALADIELAQAIFVAHNMPLRLGFCEEHIGLLASRLGRYDQALRATLRARAVFASTERADVLANCDMHLGIVAYYCGLFDLALIAYQRAYLTYKKRRIDRLSYVCQRNIALVLQVQGRTDEALALVQEILTPVKLMNDWLELAEIMQLQAQIFRDQQQHEVALQLFQQAQEMFIEQDAVGAAAECLLEQGWLYLNCDQLTSAITCLEACASALSNRPAHYWRVDYGLGRCALLQGQPDLALRYFRAASATIAKLRHLLSEHASSAIFVQACQLFDDALDLAAQCNDPQAILELAEQQRAIALQQQMLSSYGQLREGLGLLQASYPRAAATSQDAVSDDVLEDYIRTLLQHRYLVPLSDVAATTPLDLEDLRHDLNIAYPHGWAVLVFVLCRESLLIVSMDSQHLALSTTPIDHKLRRLIDQACLRRYRQYTYRDLPRQAKPETPPWAGLAALGNRLLPTKIRDNLHPDQRLLIVAGGPLHALPWAALRVHDAWLAEQAVIQLLPSLTLWPSLMKRTVPGTDALLIGCSEFGNRAPALPNAVPSLDLVQQLWSGRVTRLENAAASAQALLDLAAQGNLRRYGHIYVATHGQLVASFGRLAHLKLIDRDLVYDEIAGLHLAGALVVLAACDGAAGEVLPGEEVLSLSRALLAAGARDVIASLWETYDQAVLTLLPPLYEALLNGQDAAQGLTIAQRVLIRKSRFQHEEDVTLVSPLVWASFCVIGAGVSPVSTASDTFSTIIL